MRKTMWLVMAGVALALIGAIAAFYFALRLRNEVEVAEVEAEERKRFEELQNKIQQQHEETSKVPEGLESSTESRP